MRVRALAAAVLVVLAAALLSGCAATLDVAVEMDRTGRGDVTLTVAMDAAALQGLGLSADDPDAVAGRLLPLLDDSGWLPAEGGERVVANVFSFSDTDDGGVVLRTRKPFDNVEGLDAILGHRRPIRAVAGDDTALVSQLPDLPEAAPLLNDFTFSLGSGTGDNPGFRLFGRGGVGDIGQATCEGDRAVGLSSFLRNSLQIRYRFTIPGGPGETNADETPGSASVWNLRYEDCDALRAESGGGSSSTLFNGVVLAALSGMIVLAFGVRGLRRRRLRRAGTGL